MSVRNFSERGSLPTFLIVILAVVFIGISVAAGYILGGYFGKGSDKKTNDENVVVDNLQNSDGLLTPTNTDANTQQPPTSTSVNIPVTVENNVVKLPGLSFDLTPYQILRGDSSSSTPYQYISLPTAIADKIQWTGFYPINKLGFFNSEHIAASDNGKDGSVASFVATTYYLGGWFEYSGKNGLIVFADVECSDCMGSDSYPSSPFVLYDNQAVLLNHYKDQPSDNVYSTVEDPLSYLVREQVKVDKIFLIPYLDFPKRITVKPGVVLDYVSTEAASENAGKLSKDENIWQKMKKVGADSVLGDIYLGAETDGWSYRNFYILGRDQRVRTYSYSPTFVSNGLIDVVYSDGRKVKEYRYTTSGGCGRPSVHVVLPTQIDVTKDLIEVGKTTSGVELLGLKDSNHLLLHDFYDTTYFPTQGEQISYEEFVKERPAVFWIDPFGRVIMFELNKFAPAAECGKPVIYLYPTENTKVKVNLQVEKFSYTEPEYGNGWEVLAKPNGEVTNLSDGKKYPYLFWEGAGAGEQPESDNGFVVARDGVNKFLNEKLPQLGLQGREVSDFIEFWQPRMTKAPYYFVTFYGTSVMNQIAPLKVQPKPDTVIRILMDYKPLGKPVVAKEQKLSHPLRAGFTVIEWGGVLGRE